MFAPDTAQERACEASDDAVTFANDLTRTQQVYARLEWWATSSGTYPVERIREADGRYTVHTWPRITLWLA